MSVILFQWSVNGKINGTRVCECCCFYVFYFCQNTVNMLCYYCKIHNLHCSKTFVLLFFCSNSSLTDFVWIAANSILSHLKYWFKIKPVNQQLAASQKRIGKMLKLRLNSKARQYIEDTVERRVSLIVNWLLGAKPIGISVKCAYWQIGRHSELCLPLVTVVMRAGANTDCLGWSLWACWRQWLSLLVLAYSLFLLFWTATKNRKA